MAKATKAPTEKHPRGRPTEFRPEYCDRIIEMGKAGMSIAQMAMGFDVCRNTIKTWAAEHPEFLTAYTRAKDYSQAWWEQSAQTGLLTPGYNASLWAKSMAARFPDDYTDRNKTELTGAGGGPLSQSIEVSFVGANKGSVSEQT